MLTGSKTVDKDLAAHPPLVAQIGDAFFWELAPDNQKAPYVVYRLTENAKNNKDSNGTYDLEVWCFGNNLTASAQLSQLTKDALQNGHHRFLGAQSGYVDDDTRQGFIKLIFNFNT